MQQYVQFSKFFKICQKYPKIPDIPALKKNGKTLHAKKIQTTTTTKMDVQQEKPRCL